MSQAAAESHGEREFQRVLQNVPAGAYTCDPSGLITYFNRRAVELWGRAPKLRDHEDRFCGSFRLFTPDGAPVRHDQCWMALALQNDREYDGHEIVVERPDGVRVTVLAHANPIHDASGRLLGAVNVLVDISDRKRVEERLLEAENAKDEFLATLAHELRNPLAPVRNAVQILQLGELPTPEAHWAIDVIDRQIEQMSRLIDDLMDVSRITCNKLELRKERVALAQVVRSAVEACQPLVEARGHELTVTLPLQPIEIDADPTRLAQAIANLVNNAAKYIDGSGRIWVTAEQHAQEVTVSVRDTGIGIPPEMLSRVFEMFVQVDRSLERTQGGLGVGLTLVRRLIELHGGSVAARSDGLGKGSEFVIRLPAAAALESAPAKRPAKHRWAAARALRVLVVDDNVDSAESLCTLLRIAGHETRSAHDGQRALAIAEELRPEAAILDIGLPILDGYELAERIRQRPWGRTVLLVAVTGWGQDGDKHRAQQAGFDHHRVKPIDPAELMKLLASRAPLS